MYLLNEVLLLMFIVTQNILVCVLCQSYQSSALWNTKMMFFLWYGLLEMWLRADQKKKKLNPEKQNREKIQKEKCRT